MSLLRTFLCCFAGAALAAGCSAVRAQAPHSTWITLGTNAGPIPDAARSEPANLLEYGNEKILVDCGDGAPEQLAKANVPIRSVTAVVISHHHFDHIGGLFALLGLRFQAVPPPVLTVYGPPGTKRLVDGLVAAMQVEADFDSAGPGAPHRNPADTVKVIEIGDGDHLKIGGIPVTVRSNSHYSIPADSPLAKRFQSLSFRFDLPDRSIVYTGDTGPSKNVEELSKGADVLFSEIIDPDARLARLAPNLTPEARAAMRVHFTQEHLEPRALGLLAAEAGVKEVVLLHIGVFDADLPKALAGIREVYKGKVVVSHDLESF